MRVRSKKHHPVGDGLADQHSVKWISVEVWQPPKFQHRSLVQIERQNAMFLAFVRHVKLNRLWEKKPPQMMLDHDLPDQDGTKYAIS